MIIFNSVKLTRWDHRRDVFSSTCIVISIAVVSYSLVYIAKMGIVGILLSYSRRCLLHHLAWKIITCRRNCKLWRLSRRILILGNLANSRLLLLLLLNRIKIGLLLVDLRKLRLILLIHWLYKVLLILKQLLWLRSFLKIVSLLRLALHFRSIFILLS